MSAYPAISQDEAGLKHFCFPADFPAMLRQRLEDRFTEEVSWDIAQPSFRGGV